LRRISYKPYAFLVFALFFMMSLSQGSVDTLRSCSVASFAPSWRFVHAAKSSFFSLAASSSAGVASREIDVLRQENQNLRAQVELLKNAVAESRQIESELERLRRFDPSDPFFRRRADELLRLVDLQMHALGAKVIFREPASWSSCLWINVGEKQNQIFGKNVVAKNSPVVLGTSVVGIVEYVGKNRSRVRLLTDPGLVPSVRVARGSDGDGPGAVYLAKGEVYGSGGPLWRSRGALLKGVGFNYDFADEEGPARHLLTGEPIDQLGAGKKISLIQSDDLLITTGMDGVFPAGLRVAYVTEVKPLKDGGCSFDIEAKAAVSNLADLSFVTVLPPLEG